MQPVYREVKPNPLQNANLCSRLFFWWLNPLFKIGHKRRLEENDMYSVLPEDRSQHLGEELQVFPRKDTAGISLVMWKIIELRPQKGLKQTWKPLSWYLVNSPVKTKQLTMAALWMLGVIPVAAVKQTLRELGDEFELRYQWAFSDLASQFHVIPRIVYQNFEQVESTKVIQPIFLGKIISYFENYDPTSSVSLFEAYSYAAGLSAGTLIWAILHHLYYYHIQRVGIRLRVAVCHMIYRKALHLSSSAMGKTTTGQIVSLLSNDVNKFDQAWCAGVVLSPAPCSVLLHKELVRNMPSNDILALPVGRPTAGYCSDHLALDGNRNIMSCWDGDSHYSSAFAKLLREVVFITPPFSSMLMFPLNYKHPKGKADVNYVFIKPHSPSSIGDGKVAATEVSNCDELDLKQFPEGWRSKTAALTDDRIRTMSEVITGIRVIKMYAWEKSFVDLITRLRRKEISRILRSSYLRGMNLTSFFTVSKIMIFATFITNVLLDNVMAASQVFMVVTLYEALRFTSTLYFPMAIEKVSEAVICIQRIQNFLLLDEISQHSPQLSSDGETMVNVQDFTAFWEKSSLLSALLGELPPSQGQVRVNGRIAYVSQQPWVFPGTVRSNILFGKKYGKGRYEEVIRACALEETENIQVMLSDESHLEGSVGFKTYKNYFTAGAHWLTMVFLILVNIAAQVAYVLQDWWLAFWANEQSALYGMVYGKGNITVVLDPVWYFQTYSGTVLFGITRSLLLFYVLVNSSQVLHNKMLESILRAPVLFFDRNTIGGILNRFSKDIGQMDDSLPLMFQVFMQSSLLLIGMVGVMVATIPWIAIPVIPLGIVFFVLRRYFLKTSQDIKRLESTKMIRKEDWEKERRHHEICLYVSIDTFEKYILSHIQKMATRSPVLSHLASSLQGLWTIRVYKAEQRFQELFDKKQDLHSALNAGQFGLVLSNALTLMGMFQWSIRQSIEVENMMISVERVIEYTDLKKEAPWEYENRPLSSWPHEGDIFFDINFRYSLDGPLVLKDLRAFINSREKVGIVGRTGAGKSSLIAALFRLSEPEGSIWINEILTTSIGLHDLRKKMSVVPQEPFLFTGTMKKNLDPFNEHTDDELQNALEEVQLKEAIQVLPGKMDTELAESGSNLSVGQRQLVCLARALLRKNRILIIDEATAHVDLRTDEMIQKKIREKFAQCTVLTITHRVSTIIDSDTIMVLDSGRLEEYDEPHVLLQNTDSLFYKMVQLKEIISNLPGKMDIELAESGSNLSVGQRQLVCLARAILTKNRILIIDKATSNVDPRTDELIQERIHEKFSQCTVLIVTHRLSTIIDADGIVVLDSRTGKEFGRPYDALQNKNGIFYKMVQQLGYVNYVACRDYLLTQNIQNPGESYWIHLPESSPFSWNIKGPDLPLITVSFVTCGDNPDEEKETNFSSIPEGPKGKALTAQRSNCSIQHDSGDRTTAFSEEAICPSKVSLYTSILLVLNCIKHIRNVDAVITL
ncbi:hypothetical protein MJG53_010000 [Ovis ammon polii x Ovis aries]|uniref:Uncharacterized protein n=1 Tax=Ovis ammon polii x Ovis aries TaxID=2918886 RepID=A0ACB9UVU5_9CETA|nr:hypothetical protein MJG53_010000 [Ovis ammon polii x Ovis aries]